TPATSAPDSPPGCCASSPRSWHRYGGPPRRSPLHCPPTTPGTRSGPSPCSWPRSPSPAGPAPGACGPRRIRACARTRTRPRSSASRDEPRPISAAAPAAMNVSLVLFFDHQAHIHGLAEPHFLRRELLPVVRLGPVQHRPGGHEPLRVQVRVGRVVVPLDVIEVRGRAEGRVLVEVTGVAPEVRVVHDPVHVRLEVGDVD